MTATNHVVTGAAVATYVHQPLIAIVAAFLAHFVMDAVPHFRVTARNDMDRFKKNTFRNILVTDLSIAALLLVIVPIALNGIAAWWLVVLCMVACASPDLVWGWRFYLAIYKKIEQKRSAFSQFHTIIQWSETQPGIYVELIWFLSVSFLIILKGQ